MVSVVGWGATTVFGKKLSMEGYDEKEIMAGRFLIGFITMLPVFLAGNIVFDKGKIIADDLTDNLKQTADKEHFIHLSLLNADYQSVRTELESIGGIVDIEQLDEKNDARLNIRLTGKSDVDLRKNIYTAIKKTDWIIVEFYQETKTLETIFRELTKEK